MDMTDVLEAIETHAKAAGVALADPMTDVCIGLPYPRGRCGRVFWSGEVIPAPQMPSRFSLNGEVIGDQVIVRFFWPIRPPTRLRTRPDAVEMFAVADGLRGLLDGDLTLGGDGRHLRRGAEPDLVNIGGAPCTRSSTSSSSISYREQGDHPMTKRVGRRRRPARRRSTTSRATSAP
jgi:hypothetical protein